MRDKLIELICESIQTDECISHCNHPHCDKCELLADHLIANNVFVLPEKLKDSWELALPFMVRLFVSDEAEIEKIKGEFEFSQKKKILTDIREYLLSKEKSVNRFGDVGTIMGIGVCEFVKTALDDLTEYAEKLGVGL